MGEDCALRATRRAGREEQHGRVVERPLDDRALAVTLDGQRAVDEGAGLRGLEPTLDLRRREEDVQRHGDRAEPQDRRSRRQGSPACSGAALRHGHPPGRPLPAAPRRRPSRGGRARRTRVVLPRTAPQAARGALRRCRRGRARGSRAPRPFGENRPRRSHAYFFVVMALPKSGLTLQLSIMPTHIDPIWRPGGSS